MVPPLVCEEDGCGGVGKPGLRGRKPGLERKTHELRSHLLSANGIDMPSVDKEMAS